MLLHYRIHICLQIPLFCLHSSCLLVGNNPQFWNTPHNFFHMSISSPPNFYKEVPEILISDTLIFFVFEWVPEILISDTSLYLKIKQSFLQADLFRSCLQYCHHQTLDQFLCLCSALGTSLCNILFFVSFFSPLSAFSFFFF